MTIVQIVLLSIAGACALVSLVFNVMFIVEITAKPKEKKDENLDSVFTVNVINQIVSDNDVDAMLAQLDEETAGEEVEESEKEAVVEETAAVEGEVEDVKEESEEMDLLSAFIEEETAEEIQESKKEAEVKETVEEAKEEIKEEVKEENDESSDDEEDDDDADASEDAEILEYTGLKEEPVEYSANGSIDYSARLEKIIATRDKIERDLAKVQKAILKYERTKRRKTRNQKMLDRRAGELTNLNLVMYSVTDIKNVDEEKKIKQEELTAHIAELKASIQDAEEYIESNKEKNDHNVKMAKFLTQEKLRYNEEIAELQSLINAGDNETK